MSFSNQELALIHEIATGDAPFPDPFSELVDLIDREDDEPVFKLLLSDLTITAERKANLEREIISWYLFGGGLIHSLWDYDRGYLRHRFVAELMSDRGKKERWVVWCDDIITKVFHFLFDDYYPANGEPSAEEILLYLVKEYDYQHNLSPSMIDFINMGIFDSVGADTKAKVLSFILSGYPPGDKGSCVEDVVLAWIRHGLVSALPSNCLQELKNWVNPQPNKIDYMEAGLWQVLSTHERALMIAPFLDKAETGSKTLSRLLQLERHSPLFQETMKELHWLYINDSLYGFKTFYNNKLTENDLALVDNLNGLLPNGVCLIDFPLTVMSDEDIKPNPRLEGPYDFERLGYYVAEDRKIVLLRPAIIKASNELIIPEVVLRSIVFTHELGHYYTHRMPLWDTKDYQTGLFNDTSTFVLEGWAQLFTFWAVKSNPEYLLCFNELLKQQSAPYKVFTKYNDRPVDQMLQSLDHLRTLSSPATLQDWDSIITSI